LFKEKIDILFQDIPSTDQENILINASEIVDKERQALRDKIKKALNG
jgi:fibrillarin-like rRNA methylase